MYRSEVDGMTKTISFPALSGRLATSSAANAAAPEEIPARIPSSFARRRAYSKDWSFVTWTTSSTRAVSRFFGMKPAPIPWILCGPGAPPEITGEWTGSTATSLQRPASSASSTGRRR